MPSTMPLRIGDELLSSARVAAEATGRSAAQQIGYWARLGRELERSGSISVRDVTEVLAGARAYDDLEPKAQAVVRAAWADRIEARLDELDLAAEFAAEGRSWVELAPDGTTISHAAPRSTPDASGRPSGDQLRRRTLGERSDVARKKAAAKKKAVQRAAAQERAVKQATREGAAKQAAAKQAAKKATAATKKVAAATKGASKAGARRR